MGNADLGLLSIQKCCIFVVIEAGIRSDNVLHALSARYCGLEISKECLLLWASIEEIVSFGVHDAS